MGVRVGVFVGVRVGVLVGVGVAVLVSVGVRVGVGVRVDVGVGLAVGVLVGPTTAILRANSEVLPRPSVVCAVRIVPIGNDVPSSTAKVPLLAATPSAKNVWPSPKLSPAGLFTTNLSAMKICTLHPGQVVPDTWVGEAPVSTGMAIS